MNKLKKQSDPAEESDLEKRVKQMMDTSLPDEPSVASASEEPVSIQSVSSPLDAPETSSPQSTAPILPNSEPKTAKTPKTKTPTSSASKKVIIPITHDTNSEPTSVAKAQELAPLENPVDEVPEDPVAQILPEHANVSVGELADKINQSLSDQVATGDKVQAENISSESPEVTDNLTEADEVASPIQSAIEDPATDKAVSEIIAAESDEILEVEDAMRDTDAPLKLAKTHRNLSEILKIWWSKSWFRWGVVGFFVVLIIGTVAVPSSRYFALNLAGVRAKSSIEVLDASTQQPLKNVTVKIGEVTGLTDQTGKANLSGIKLGTNSVTISKRAFAPISKTLVIGLGNNPLGEYSITPTGTQYNFSTNDYLSDKPIAKVEATNGDASALSDDKGQIKLTIDKPSDTKFSVTIKADGYKTETVTIDPNDKSTHKLKLVPARKQVYVSKRSGKYDIFSQFIDGREEKLVLAGSGSERDDMVLVPHPRDDILAYVSTRAGQHNSDGFTLSNLLLVNLADNSTTNITASERIKIIQWSGDRLIYVQVAAGSSANSPKRFRLMAYNYKDASSHELASNNYFNDVIYANGSVYFAPSSALQSGKVGLFKINPDGSSQQQVFGQEVWNILRTSYDHFALAVQQQWYDYKTGEANAVKLNTAPADQNSRIYINNPDDSRSVWADLRDGKGVLALLDTATNKETIIHSQSGLKYPLRWLNSSTITYRVKTETETADYAISIDGGQSVKIRDVTNSAGLDRWLSN